MRSALLASALVTVALAGCGDTIYSTRPHIDDGLVPDNFGALTFKRQAEAEAFYARAGTRSLVKEGRVYTVGHANIVDASYQVALFKDDVDVTAPEVFIGIQETIAEGNFEPRTVHELMVQVMRLTDQTIYMWFPPKQNTYCLLIVSKRFTSSDQLMRAIIEYQQGRVPVAVPIPSPKIVVQQPGAVPSPPSGPRPSTNSPSPGA